MERTQIEAWLKSIRVDLEEVESVLAPLLRQRAALEERQRLVETLLTSMDTDFEDKRAVASFRPTDSVPVHETVVARVTEILEEAGKPLHIKEILVRYREKGYEVPGAGGPANLIVHMRRASAFVSPKRGFYTLAKKPKGG